MCRKDLGEKIANIEYAFQALYTLPEGVSVPDGRTKPWGAGQAFWQQRM